MVGWIFTLAPSMTTKVMFSTRRTRRENSHRVSLALLKIACGSSPKCMWNIWIKYVCDRHCHWGQAPRPSRWSWQIYCWQDCSCSFSSYGPTATGVQQNERRIYLQLHLEVWERQTSWREWKHWERYIEFPSSDFKKKMDKRRREVHRKHWGCERKTWLEMENRKKRKVKE